MARRFWSRNLEAANAWAGLHPREAAQVQRPHGLRRPARALLLRELPVGHHMMMP
jgi:hypothetical protein